MAIATSNAQNESGIFELNFRDERYLPFEGNGAISKWTIELNTVPELRQFDYDTISDVILHLKYTAREGDQSFREAVVTNLQQQLNNAIQNGLSLSVIFDIKREYSSEWYQFNSIASTGASQTMQLSISKDRLPFFTADKNVRVTQVKLFAKKKDDNADPIPINGNRTLVQDDFNLFSAVIINTPSDLSAETGLSLSFTMNVDDIAKVENFYLLWFYAFNT